MMNTTPLGREIHINKVIRSINSHWRYVNSLRQRCIEMQVQGLNLELCEQINLIRLYQTISQECDLAKEMYEHDLEIAERELIIGGGRASDLEHVQKIAAIQTELITIKKDIKEALDAIQQEIDCIIHARNVEEVEIDSKMDIIRKMEDYVESQGIKIPE